MKQSHNQSADLFSLLADFRPHRSDEIKEVVYGSMYLGSVRISARTKDLRDGDWPGRFKCEFEKRGKLYCWQDEQIPTLSVYRLKPLDEWENQVEAHKALLYINGEGRPRGAFPVQRRTRQQEAASVKEVVERFKNIPAKEPEHVEAPSNQTLF
jgi:hypothetical protein